MKQSIDVFGILDISQFHRSEEQGVWTFTAEISELGLKRLPEVLKAQGRRTVLTFNFDKRDMSGDDVAGWWFKSAGLSYKLLIIND